MTAVAAKTPDVPAPLTFPVHTGKSLTLVEMSAVLARSFAKVIVIAGDAESGKSTLLATLYEQFQHGPFADLEFAGSLTLHGFEERIHDSRIASFRAQSVTPRTSRQDGVRFLHLKVKAQECKAMTELLISDLAGELFEDLRSSTDACRRFPALRRADCFVCVVDGEALVDSQRCHRVTVQARDFVRSVLDASVLPDGGGVQLLLTKWDVVTASADKAKANSMWDDLVEQVKGHCTARAVPFSAVKTSARPKLSVDVSAAFGMAGMVQTWMVGQLDRRTISVPANALAEPFREIDRFGALAPRRGGQP